MILIDADVLGRNRTGEETYVLNLLRQLPLVAPDLSFGAVTRNCMLRRLGGSGAPPSAKFSTVLGTLSAVAASPRAMVPAAGAV